MGFWPPLCDTEAMRFDENPPSPDRIVDTRNPDTKNNILMSLGVIVFLIIGGILLWWFARESS